jgi:D-alanyl-D-alanine carboxypeptidase (penicillin-binding protein 5/6)
MIKIKIFILFLFFTLSVYSWGSPKINAKSAILIDYNSDKVLYEINPDAHIYPASMTKIMTTIVAFDLLEQGKINLEDQVIVSEKAWRMSQSGFSSMFIMLNDSVTIEELLKGIIIVSGNDACVSLAEGIAGTEENFVEMMNEKAEEIGLLNTNFSNSSGINHPQNFSTVRDIAIMSKYLIANYPKYYEYFKEIEFTWDRTGGDPIKQGNRNPLLYKNIGADGIKTGYLDSEKYSLAASVIGEKRRIISVISGSQTKKARSLDSIKLISWALRNTATYEIAEKNIPNFKFKTWLGKEDFVNGIVKEDMYVTIAKKEIKDLKVTINYNGPIKAPIKKDQEIGTLIVKIDDEEIRSLPIYSNKKIKKVNFFKSLFLSLNYMIWGDA